MELSERLKAITDEINYKTIADIGTDHGYVPIYAIMSGKIQKAIACDINKGPLKTAKKNIAEHSLSKIIETRQSNGLGALQPGEVETAVIAGMGGMLIIDILSKSPLVTAALHQLLLQPQHDIPAVRRYVHSIGYKIVNEQILYEDNKFYTIINCHKGTDVMYNESDYLLGKILRECHSPVFKRWLEDEAAKLERVMTLLSSTNAESADINTRKQELSSLLKIYKEVLAQQSTNKEITVHTKSTL